MDFIPRASASISIVMNWVARSKKTRHALGDMLFRADMLSALNTFEIAKLHSFSKFVSYAINRHSLYLSEKSWRIISKISSCPSSGVSIFSTFIPFLRVSEVGFVESHLTTGERLAAVVLPPVPLFGEAA